MYVVYLCIHVHCLFVKQNNGGVRKKPTEEEKEETDIDCALEKEKEKNHLYIGNVDTYMYVLYVYFALA